MVTRAPKCVSRNPFTPLVRCEHMALKNIFGPDESTTNADGVSGSIALIVLSLMGYMGADIVFIESLCLFLAAAFVGLLVAYLRLGLRDGFFVTVEEGGE